MNTKFLLSNYLLKMDELNLVALRFMEIEHDPAEIADKVFDLLVDAYIEGFAGVGLLLGDTVGAPLPSQMRSAINLKIEGKTFRNRVIEHAHNEDWQRVMVVVDTESHRVFNAGADDRAGMFERRTNSTVVKTWLTVLDEKVRETHSYLQGDEVRLRDKFFTFDGDSAYYPGDFERAENNVNCRCILSYSDMGNPILG